MKWISNPAMVTRTKRQCESNKLSFIPAGTSLMKEKKGSVSQNLCWMCDQTIKQSTYRPEQGSDCHAKEHLHQHTETVLSPDHPSLCHSWKAREYERSPDSQFDVNQWLQWLTHRRSLNHDNCSGKHHVRRIPIVQLAHGAVACVPLSITHNVKPFG